MPGVSEGIRGERRGWEDGVRKMGKGKEGKRRAGDLSRLVSLH